tara:strand:- start:772 stop:1596 length:825 start_codon:yes stop_codon:yes gene_type:complete
VTDINTPIAFVKSSPQHSLLEQHIDYYFYIHQTLEHPSFLTENIIPFPRVTFGYFFDAPFSVTNLSNQETKVLDFAISPLTTNVVEVTPTTSTIKIIGAHLKPYALAYFTHKSIHTLPWVISPLDLLGEAAQKFKNDIQTATTIDALFTIAEAAFIDAFQEKDLSLVQKTIEELDYSLGEITLEDIAEKHGVSTRTIRNHFLQEVGCTPKTYVQLLRMKQSLWKMLNNSENLTQIGIESNYFDQAHFSKSMKKMIGQSPKSIRKDLPHFRFLQF